MIGTVIGAVAAILSVFFTGWATYVSAQVAQDQLDQSREENEKEERQQASRVTFWGESYYSEASPQKVHLVNRTPDAVTDVYVYALNMASDRKRYSLVGIESGVPPCSELVFKVSDQQAIIDSKKGKAEVVPLKRLYLEGFVFTDSNGVKWIRELESLSRASESKPPTGRNGTFIIQEIEVKRVDPCDEYSSK